MQIRLLKCWVQLLKHSSSTLNIGTKFKWDATRVNSMRESLGQVLDRTVTHDTHPLYTTVLSLVFFFFFTTHGSCYHYNGYDIVFLELVSVTSSTTLTLNLYKSISGKILLQIYVWYASIKNVSFKKFIFM